MRGNHNERQAEANRLKKPYLTPISRAHSTSWAPHSAPHSPPFASASRELAAPPFSQAQLPPGGYSQVQQPPPQTSPVGLPLGCRQPLLGSSLTLGRSRQRGTIQLKQTRECENNQHFKTSGCVRYHNIAIEFVKCVGSILTCQSLWLKVC